MIRKLYECGCFDYKKFIFDNQKKLLLPPGALVVLIEMLNQYQNNKHMTLASVQQNLTYSAEEFDKCVTTLLEREFCSVYVFSDNGMLKDAVSLDGFFQRVKDILDGAQIQDTENEFFQITQFIQKEINRILTADELEIVSSLITDDRIVLSDIEDAMKYMKEHFKVLSVKNLVVSISRYREEPKEATEAIPDFYKDFLKNVK